MQGIPVIITKRREVCGLKKYLRRVIDLVMVLLMPLLMSYSLIGEMLHEWIGISIVALFIVHHILNRNWIMNIGRGRYSVVRVLMLLVNLALFVIMLALPISGILMSKHVFAFLHISVGTDLARMVHLCLSNWGLVLMSVHAGFHFNQMLKHPMKAPKGRAVAICIMAVVALYGAFAFHKRQLFSYMTLQNQFVFFDFSEPVIVFLFDYLMIMGLWMVAGYVVISLARKYFH